MRQTSWAIRRSVLRPTIGSIEGHNSNWVFILSTYQVADDGAEVGHLDICFRPDPAESAEIVLNEINVATIGAED